jgi:hypothetical protein
MSPFETVEIGEAFFLVVDLAVIVVFGEVLGVVPELFGATVLGAVDD